VERWAIFCAELRDPYDRGTFLKPGDLFTREWRVKKAAEDAKQQLLEMASKMSEIPCETICGSKMMNGLVR